MSHNMSRGKKWAQFEKQYPPSGWTSDTKIWTTGEAGVNLLVCKGILKNRIWTKL